MRYRRLFEVEVRHEFDGDVGSPDLEIEPRTWRDDGRRMLERQRLIARPRPGGVEVLAEVDGEGKPRISLEGGIRLAFDLRVGGDFILYTDVDAWASAPLPTYRASSPGGGPLALEVGEAGPRAGIVAALEIVGVTDEWIAAPPRFTLDLAAQRARWVYYLITGRDAAGPPKIEDRRQGGGLAFTVAELGEATSEADDPVGRRLQGLHAGRRCFRLTSASAVVCRRAPLRRLALLLGDEVLVPELPNPSIHSRSRLKVEADDEPTTTLFRVLEY